MLQAYSKKISEKHLYPKYESCKVPSGYTYIPGVKWYLKTFCNISSEEFTTSADIYTVVTSGYISLFLYFFISKTIYFLDKKTKREYQVFSFPRNFLLDLLTKMFSKQQYLIHISGYKKIYFKFNIEIILYDAKQKEIDI